MKFPNFNMNKSFAARALVLLAGLLLMAAAASAQTAPGNLGVEIDQCANGPLSAPIQCNVATANDGYVRGQLGSSKSHYLEGQFVPIRLVTTGAVVSQSYTVTLGYDYTKSGKYANDYISTYNLTENIGNDPCAGVSGCNSGSSTTFPIPNDPQVNAGFDGISGTSDDITYTPGLLTCFGCTITNVSNFTLTGSTSGDSSKLFAVTFTADSSTSVIAYSSHISTRTDWGINNSAIAITGSPYHNFIDSFPGANQGNRDLQMSADAIIFPATVTIIKLVNNAGFSDNFHSFGFTSTNFGFPTFSLMDTDSGQFTSGPGGSISNANITNFDAQTGTITVTENDPTGTGYTLLSMSCDVQPGGLNVLGTATPGTTASRTVTIVPAEGNFITCTYTNSQLTVTAAPATVSGRVTTAAGAGIKGVSVALNDLTTGQTRYTLTNSFGYYTFSNAQTEDFYAVAVESKKYRFQTNIQTFTLQNDLLDVNFVALP